ncbi:PfaB family protein [Colwellia sp. TT2012]|uniref:PfaB family protein n=1 Tax=Colwellia sp. TT2012 TaxID=1720342 RepID=UPI000708ECDF|nr:PfaB family protein [Colwellia sp. TT2012]
MAKGNYSSAIIGLDAQFENQFTVQNNIDNVERALYLGKNLGKEQGQGQGEEQDKVLTLSVKASVERMALANKVNSADIKVILLAESAVSEMVDIDVDVDSAIVVSSFAQAMLQIDVLIGQHALVALVGVNLAESLSHVLSAEPGQQSSAGNDLAVDTVTTISFDENFSGYQNCHGLAAILFASISFAQSNNSYVYSWLKGFAVGDEVTNSTEVTEVTASALDNAQVSANDIALLEVSALADSKLATAESSGLIASYAHQKKLNTAVSCARSLTGEGAGFSQVFGLLRTIIALQQRYIPAITDWQQPAENELIHWQNSSFYLATEARPWYPHPAGNAHLAAYSCLAANNDYCHVILAENKIIVAGEKHPLVDIRDNGFIACSDLKMVLVAADNQQSLLSKLTELESSLQKHAQSIQAIALSYYQQAKSIKNTYSIVLLCESKTELLKEVASAKSGIVTALATGKEWRTPKGSYFTPKPVNRDGDTNNVSFLYPGIGATYIGLGRDLLHLFPEIYQDVANLADDIGASLKDTLLNPRSVVRPSFKALKQLDLDLRGNLADIAEAGVGFACVFTKVFENVFKLKADFATGYSMGEVSMYAALGAWQQPGLMSARLANSDTFNERLCGDLLTLREHWGLPELSETTGKNDEFIWETYTIKATLAEVIAASEGEDRVYCTIINTPDSLLIAGYPEDCLRVIKKLGVRAMALNMANAIHSAPANIEYDDMVELYTMDVTSRLPTKMYSSSCYLPIPQLSKAIAHSVAKCLCERVDFPRLINTMYDQGARVFIEMGPGRSLCSWTDKILDFDLDGKGNGQRKPRVAVPVNAKGTSDELTYFRAVAKLISHGVKLDLRRLFYGSIIVQKK